MNQNVFDVIVIGGGAAGFFGAIQIGEKKPGQRILILEKSSKLLSKVKISGGGRCNVTNHCFEATALSRHYPRGEKQLKQLFKKFQVKNTVAWFESKGVAIKAEDDGRMFPKSNNSQTIIDCFFQEIQRHNILIEMNCPVEEIFKEEKYFTIITQFGKHFQARTILIATGGNPNAHAYQWLEKLGHTINKPIPSLFTFNDSKKEFTDLMGVAVANADVKIAGTKFSKNGPVLITHWGLSGPAIIKLSAWAAEYLHQINYQFTVLVSWVGVIKEEEFRSSMLEQKRHHGKQKIFTNSLFDLPSRLWQRLCILSEIDEQKIWAELPQKNLNKLIELLIRTPFDIKGKTTFKEEFVTCGGVDLKDVDFETMESKKVKNIFFAGEVLNIDGETGGFNFQSAWTTAYVAAEAIAKSQ
jgi:predicted Rossmann fold flavoprotein